MKLNKNFVRLKRYFLGKTVVVPSDNREKLKLKSIDSTFVGNNYNWKNSKKNFYNGYSNFRNNPYSRMYKFREYDLMERDPIIARSLDILSEGACQKNEYEETLKVVCDNDQIKTSLEHLFYEIMNVNFNLKNYTRGLLKYGDLFLYLNIEEKYGITDIIPLSSLDVEREEHEDGITTFKAQGIFNEELGEENIAHFRNGKNMELYPYGTSLLEPVRRYWKMLSLLEDFMMVYYLLRSVNPRVFRVDVGSLNRDQSLEYINKYKDMFKKTPLQDHESGEYDIYYDPMSRIEDVFLPVRQGYDNTTFDEIPAGTETSITEGIEYLRRKMMSGLGVPNFLLNYEEQINSRSVAAGEDIRLGAFIESIQDILLDELQKIAIVHLILQGYDEKDLYSFELQLTPPSDLREIEKLEKLEARISTANALKDSGFYGKKFIYENILKHGEDEIEDIKNDIMNDMLEEKFLEEHLQNVSFDEPEEEPEEEQTDSEGGEGSQGGQLPATTSMDDTQQASESGRADELLGERASDDPTRRTTTTDDRDPE